LGQQAIYSWASRKHERLQSESDSRSDLTRKEKKDSTGTRAMGK
jgi:hypothetical protein